VGDHHIPPVKRLKIPRFVAAVLLAGSSLGFGQLSLSFSTGATYRQSPSEVSFRGTGTSSSGTFGVGLLDGSATITPCPTNGALAWFAANPLIGCPQGATAYIVGGDLDNNGVRDDFSYWEITAVTPAVAIAPDSPFACKVYSHPPCGFPMDLGFNDGTTTIYFNVQTEATSEYKISSYSNSKTYGSRAEMETELVPGLYEFLFPVRRNPGVTVKIPVIHRLIPEGYRKQNHVGQGFRFTKLNGSPLVWSADGYVLLDPRVVNTFEWEGTGIEVMMPLSDVTYFSILDFGAPYGGDPLRNASATAPTLFPGFAAPGTSRVLLSSAIATSCTLPPGFIPIASPPKEGVAQFTMLRSAATSSVAADNSQRIFQMPLRFVDTYEGWAVVSFKPGTPASSREKTADPDKDGFTNWEEYSAVPKTNPMLASSKPAAHTLNFVKGRATRSTTAATPGFWEMKTIKADVYPAISYEYEFSTDLQTWRTIGIDDPDWLLINTDADPATNTPGEIKVQSKHAQLTGVGFLRVKKAETTPQVQLSTE
jgi:hypothetical protein